MKQIFTDVPEKWKGITDRTSSYGTALRTGYSSCTGRVRSRYGCGVGLVSEKRSRMQILPFDINCKNIRSSQGACTILWL